MTDSDRDDAIAEEENALRWGLLEYHGVLINLMDRLQKLRIQLLDVMGETTVDDPELMAECARAFAIIEDVGEVFYGKDDGHRTGVNSHLNYYENLCAKRSEKKEGDDVGDDRD